MVCAAEAPIIFWSSYSSVPLIMTHEFNVDLNIPKKKNTLIAPGLFYHVNNEWQSRQPFPALNEEEAINLNLAVMARSTVTHHLRQIPEEEKQYSNWGATFALKRNLFPPPHPLSSRCTPLTKKKQFPSPCPFPRYQLLPSPLPYCLTPLSSHPIPSRSPPLQNATPRTDGYPFVSLLQYVYPLPPPLPI